MNWFRSRNQKNESPLETVRRAEGDLQVARRRLRENEEKLAAIERRLVELAPGTKERRLASAQKASLTRSSEGLKNLIRVNIALIKQGKLTARSNEEASAIAETAQSAIPIADVDDQIPSPRISSSEQEDTSEAENDADEESSEDESDAQSEGDADASSDAISPGSEETEEESEEDASTEADSASQVDEEEDTEDEGDYTEEEEKEDDLPDDSVGGLSLKCVSTIPENYPSSSTSEEPSQTVVLVFKEITDAVRTVLEEGDAESTGNRFAEWVSANTADDGRKWARGWLDALNEVSRGTESAAELWLKYTDNWRTAHQSPALDKISELLAVCKLPNAVYALDTVNYSTFLMANPTNSGTLPLLEVMTMAEETPSAADCRMYDTGMLPAYWIEYTSQGNSNPNGVDFDWASAYGKAKKCFDDLEVQSPSITECPVLCRPKGRRVTV